LARVTEARDPGAISLWPSPNEVLFVKNVTHQPTLGAGHWGPGWFEYIESYRDVARALVEISVADDHERMSMPHLAGIPVLFLYRHYLELVMKELLLDGARVMDQPVTSAELAERFGHDLRRLWEACKETVDVIWPGSSDWRANELAVLTEQIGELAAVDPGSFSARYPVGRDGTKSLPAETFMSYDVAVFADGVERIGDIITGMTVGIYETFVNAADGP